MSTRIDTKFAELKTQGRPGFVSYIMSGDPDYDTSLEILRGLPDAGADVIELGMCFTDPMADGVAIQLAAQRALRAVGATGAASGAVPGRPRGARRPVAC